MFNFRKAAVYLVLMVLFLGLIMPAMAFAQEPTSDPSGQPQIVVETQPTEETNWLLMGMLVGGVVIVLGFAYFQNETSKALAAQMPPEAIEFMKQVTVVALSIAQSQAAKTTTLADDNILAALRNLVQGNGGIGEPPASG